MQPTRRAFLAGGITAANVALGASSCGNVDFEPWNIVWIVADNLSPDLSCYGSSEVNTPNMARLAHEGARFTHAYVTCPVCSPLRSAPITGMYQTSIGAHAHRSHLDDSFTLSAPVRLIRDDFRAGGYYTVNDHDSGLDGRNRTDFNFQHGKPFDGSNWRDCARGQPFYAQVNLFGPHRGRPSDSWAWTKRHGVRTDPNAITPPQYDPQDDVSKREWAGSLDAV